MSKKTNLECAKPKSDRCLPILFAVAFCISSGASAVQYVASEKPASLAGGDITFKYDASDNITELRMRSDLNETLTLTGDTLNLAANAKIIVGQNTNIIENTISNAGALGFGITNLTHNAIKYSYTSADHKDSGLPTNSYETLFSGVRLADLSPVSAVGANTIQGNVMQPYFVWRGEDTMLVEFHCTNGQYVSACHVELKQDGDDVVGKTIAAGYINLKNALPYYGYGICTNISPRIEADVKTYTIGAPDAPGDKYCYNVRKLVFGPRREEYVYNGDLLHNSRDTVVARNTSLDDMEFVYAVCGYNRTIRALPHSTLYPHHVKLTGDVLSAQFHTLDGGITKCVKVELRQSGADVVARVAYAKYVRDQAEDYDFDEPNENYHNYAVATMDNWSEGNSNIYGVDFLALRRKSRSRLVLPVSGSVSCTGNRYGSGVEVTFEATGGSATVGFPGGSATNPKNSMTDSAYVFKGTSASPLTVNLDCRNALPYGATEIYGNTGFYINVSPGNSYGLSGGNSVITAHPGSTIYQKGGLVFIQSGQKVVLDAATLYVQYNQDTDLTYANDVTLANGARIIPTGKAIQAGYNPNTAWKITGEGAVTNEASIRLVAGGTTATGAYRALTIDVEDTVEGAAADFVQRGDIYNFDNYPNTSIIKTGAGTMLMNGTILYTQAPTHVVEGALVLNKSGAAVGEASFSLEGGTLGLAAGTSNAVSGVALTEPSALRVGAGATFAMDTLDVPDGTTLAIEYDGDVDGAGVRVVAQLDGETLSRIRLNGKRAAQSSNGYLHRRGFVFVVK